MYKIKNNELKLNVIRTNKEDEKIATNFKPTKDEDVKNKSYLDEKLSKREGHISILEKDYNEIILLNNKQSVDEVLIQGAVKTKIQIIFDKGLFVVFPNPDNVLENFLFVERRRPDWEEVVMSLNSFVHKNDIESKAASIIKTF